MERKRKVPAMTPFPASARKSHSPGSVAAADGGGWGACREAAGAVGVAAAGTEEGEVASGVRVGDGRGGDVGVSRGRGEAVAVGEGTGVAGPGVGGELAGGGAGAGVGFGVAVAERDGRGGAVGVAGILPGEGERVGAGGCSSAITLGAGVVDGVAVGRGDVGTGLAGRGDGAAGFGFAVGVAVAAAREASAVGVARRATTTFGPQEAEASRRAVAQRAPEHWRTGVTGVLIRRASYLDGPCASASRSFPAGTFSSLVLFPEGQRTVRRLAASASFRPK